MRTLAHFPPQIARLHRIYSDAGITPGVGKALAQLPEDRAVSMREFASFLHCDNSYVTSVVDALEEKGLVERRAHPSDRRIKVVVLTDEGALVAKTARAELADPPPSFESLSDTEAEQLRRLMRKLSAD